MPHALDYAPRLPWYKRRRTRRLITWTLVLLSVAIPTWCFGPFAYRRTILLYWQHRCMTHLDPPGTIAMDATSIPPSTFRSAATGLRWPPPEWDQYCAAVYSEDGIRTLLVIDLEILDSGIDGHAVLLHRCTCPAGDRIVIALAHSDSSGLRAGYICKAGIDTFLIFPGTFLHDPSLVIATTASSSPTNLYIPLDKSDSLRVYTGQPDPADPAAFTIDFDLNGIRHTARFALAPTGDQINLISVTPPL